MVPLLDSRRVDVPNDLVSFALLAPALFIGMLAVYHLAKTRFATDRQRSYILSSLSAGLLSLASVPFVSMYLRHGIAAVYTAAQAGWMATLSWLSVVWFATYLSADLIVGSLYYPSQIGLVTGWIHHTVYIGIMVHLLTSNHSPVFLIATVMELPTLDLGLSNLYPSIRSDLRFLSLFFLIRIAFHAVLLVDCARPESRRVMDGSWVPTGILVLALVLHVSWFSGGLKGYLKRRSRHQSKVDNLTAEQIAEVVVENAEKTETEGLLLADRDTGSGSSSPADSPLITPRTPSSGPISYLNNLASIPAFSSLPPLSVPKQLPTVSIPSLSELTAAINAKARDPMPWGFKEAVRNRWDEQRGRFAQGVDITALRFRRRGAPFVSGVDEDIPVDVAVGAS